MIVIDRSAIAAIFFGEAEATQFSVLIAADRVA